MHDPSVLRAYVPEVADLAVIISRLDRKPRYPNPARWRASDEGMTSSHTSAQQKNDKHDNHNEYYRSNTYVHGLFPPSRQRMALA